MAKIYDTLTDELIDFIHNQPLFFVASAPLAGAGHVNLSPKGLDCLRVLSPMQLAYLDMTGSGNETSAHLHENGRITIMFCAFQGRPLILRLYGQGQVVLPNDPRWHEFASHFPTLPGTRQIVIVDMHRVQTSCGFGVPLMELIGQRDTLLRWAESKDDQQLQAYRAENNAMSIDGLVAPLGEE